MKNKFNEIRNNALKEAEAINEINDLKNVKSKYLGKKGPLSEVMKNMKDLSVEDKKTIGQLSNEVKQYLEELFEDTRLRIESYLIEKKLKSETVDVTLPGNKINKGSIHPLSSIIRSLEELFIGLGYEIKEGPEIENDEYNFEKLNLPKDHPARDMQDTFYISETHLLRTHTSPVQVRTMLESNGEPIKIICPGKVYRRDDDDATHSHQFMQIEGLVLGSNITMADLKGTLLLVAKTMFGEDRELRLRPSYFPFTEPSVEVDVTCSKCGGTGCNICKSTGWIEILGAGMVNKDVLNMCGYDDERIQGFAFGIGVERIAMLRYGVDDIRHFYTNDIRFIKQFKESK